MPAVRQALKRTRQTVKRQERNEPIRSAVKTAIKKAVQAVEKKDVALARDAYRLAIKTLSKAASSGVLPKTRAARKISRITHLAKKLLPEALQISSK